MPSSKPSKSSKSLRSRNDFDSLDDFDKFDGNSQADARDPQVSASAKIRPSDRNPLTLVIVWIILPEGSGHKHF